MSYRKRENQRENLARLVRTHAAALARLGLPSSVFRTEATLMEFLVTGIASDSTDLRIMTDEQFLLIERAVQKLFPDFNLHEGSTAAFASERLKQFGRYGPASKEDCENEAHRMNLSPER